jgi:iron complex outermembrane receptor protein
MRVRFCTKNQFFRRPWLASASAAALMATSAHAQEVPAQDKLGAGAPAQSATSATGDKGTPVNGTLPRDGSGTQTAVPADAAGTIAQPDTAANDTAGDEIVVTGFRQSLATAQALKFNSDQFVDSITATDIGKLPDKNVSEALQRISGIQIDRTFGEGSGVQIRGLSQVKTELNGRDVFGA